MFKDNCNGSGDARQTRSLNPRKGIAPPGSPQDLPAQAKCLSCWTPREQALRKSLEQGKTVVVSMRTDLALVEWARGLDLFVSLDGKTEWGDWDTLSEGGPVEEVFAAFVVYCALKKRLHQRLGALKGKALGYGQATACCQAEYLALLAEGGPELLGQMLQFAAAFTEADLDRLVAWARRQLPRTPTQFLHQATSKANGRRVPGRYAQAVQAARELTRKEKQALLRWLEQGCPEPD